MNHRHGKRILGAAGLVLLLSGSTHAANWHVATSGDDNGDGSEKTPFASLTRAVETAAKTAGPCEIILHTGVYPGDTTIPAPPANLTNPSPWIIRAAQTADGKYEEVIIDGGQRIIEAQAVDAKRGIYFQPFTLVNFEPGMWEVKSRTRYTFVADRRSVEAFPASLAPGRFSVDGEEKEGVFFHTSDGKSPAAHDLRMARDRHGLMVSRPNVTVKGLRFRNFQLYFGVYGVFIDAANVTVESCDAWNCYGAVAVGEKIPDATIRRCTARDVATGVKSYGRNTIVEDCRFFRTDDSFVVQEDSQDQCGIQFYSSHVQTARRNLCVGFNLGIFIKASGGVLVLENNTVVAPPKGGEQGIGPNTWRPGSICSGNVVVGYNDPLSLGAGLIQESRITGNQFWLASDQKRMKEVVAKIKDATGGENVVAPPLFVDERKEDYRLAPGDTVAQVPSSVPAETSAPVTPAGPAQLVAKPVVRTSEQGAIVTFQTDRPCTARIEWGTEKELLNIRVDGPETHRADHCLAITGPVKPRAKGWFRIRLDNGSGAGAGVHLGQFKFKGPARVLHVATTGADKENGGTASRPFASIQFAVDRALPGDRVLVAPGIYTGTVWVKHGGVAGHPIRIESAEPWGAVLDGKREAEHAIRLGRVAKAPETWLPGCLDPSGVSHIEISGFEMRWYNGLCIRADEAQDIVITGCKFWSRHYVKGRPGVCEGIGAYHCERVTIDHNLFFMLNTAVRFNHSVGLRLTNNTAARCFHRVIGIVGASKIYMRNNSFAFGGSYLLAIHGVDLKSVDSDYNNLAVQLREDAVGYSTAPAEEKLKREDNDFHYGESKALSAWDERTPEKPDPYLPTLTAWREATGQDKHSISAHPRYADPRNRDFRLLPNSPNIGAGENGKDIGALEVIRNEKH